MPPAARMTDLLACPVGGVGMIQPPCCPTVLIGYLPAARMLDQTVCALGPDAIAPPCSTTVHIGAVPAARLGDSTVAHQAKIIPPCCPTVIIGG